MARRRTTRRKPVAPQLGLVCITSSQAVRFRVITRARFLKLTPAKRRDALTELYADNLGRMFEALAFCNLHNIRLYRATSDPFPLCDEREGMAVLDAMRHQLAAFGRRAEALNIRIVLHPDQFVVLSSLTEKVVATSIHILTRQADVFDRLGLPRTTWSAITLHGGKSGRADALVEVIAGLPAPVRSRLVLENDEYAYSAAEILEVCTRARVSMVFDVHHHLIREKLDDFEHPSVRHFVKAARDTWPDPAWQIVHLSNGRDRITDPRHSDLITRVPTAYDDVPFVEVEAKGKERAIEHLRSIWPAAEPNRPVA